MFQYLILDFVVLYYTILCYAMVYYYTIPYHTVPYPSLLYPEGEAPLTWRTLGAGREALEGVRGLLVEVDAPLVPGWASGRASLGMGA